ncbi:unnamed protein product [Arabidopsis lyrata]|nr:unnamed protein product [Arabidopsis lyrata]
MNKMNIVLKTENDERKKEIVTFSRNTSAWSTNFNALCLLVMYSYSC